MERFVILTHDYPVLHWDLLLEAGETCRTWRLAEEPFPARQIPAEQIADHRLEYLSYEGPVRGDRGQVARWEFGTYSMPRDTADEIVLTLSGQQWNGECRLRRIAGASWMAVFGCDAEAEINDD